VEARLGIAVMLSNAPTTNDEFAKSTSVNSRSYHLMRLLVSMGIFSAEKNEEFPFFEAYDFLEVKTIVDVEGNIGTLGGYSYSQSQDASLFV
jgi:hypothetical protein